MNSPVEHSLSSKDKSKDKSRDKPYHSRHYAKNRKNICARRRERYAEQRVERSWHILDLPDYMWFHTNNCGRTQLLINTNTNEAVLLWQKARDLPPLGTGQIFEHRLEPMQRATKD